MAKKSPAADESDIRLRLDADFPPLSDEEIVTYADRECLTLVDLIVITNGQIRPGKVGLFVVGEQEISLPRLTDFDFETSATSNIKDCSQTIEASRLKLPCTPYEFLEWAENWVLLICGGYRSVKFDETGDLKIGADFELPAAFVNAVAAPKNANRTPDRAEPVSGVGSPEWRRQNAKAGAAAKHNRPGGTREKQQRIRELWATGKYSSRDICAEQECAALEMSFSAARKALRNTPDP